MSTLREWVEDEWESCPKGAAINTFDFDEGLKVGYEFALAYVLAELKAREEAERERVNENVKALDGYAGEVLAEKEGGAK